MNEAGRSLVSGRQQPQKQQMSIDQECYNYTDLSLFLLLGAPKSEARVLMCKVFGGGWEGVSLLNLKPVPIYENKLSFYIYNCV